MNLNDSEEPFNWAEAKCRADTLRLMQNISRQ